jgi:hypothetical protein
MEENEVVENTESVSADVAPEADVTPTEVPQKTAAEAVAAHAESVIKARGDKEGTSVSADGTPVPEFKPNYKLKVLDKEHEIPKEFQSLIKDSASEKQVREIFEKAYGLDSVKPKYQDLKTKYAETAQKYEGVTHALSDLRNTYNSAVQEGNFLKLDKFFEKLEIPEEVILKYALAKVELNEMAPEQKALMEGKLKVERQNEEFSQNLSRTQELMAEQAVQMKMFQFESSLARPDVRSFSENFDRSFAKPGAFKEEVRKAGELAWYTEKVDLTPDQAIERVMGRYGNLVKPVATPATEGTAELPIGEPQKKVVVKPHTQTIPNISGKGTSPLKTKPKSIQDLKELAKQY